MPMPKGVLYSTVTVHRHAQEMARAFDEFGQLKLWHGGWVHAPRASRLGAFLEGAKEFFPGIESALSRRRLVTLNHPQLRMKYFGEMARLALGKGLRQPLWGDRIWEWQEKSLAALEALQAARVLGAIGVSNFMVPHLEELLRQARVKPAANQIEVSPFLQQRAARALCTQHGITVQAYSPLTKGLRLSHPVVLGVAQAVRRSPAQVLLRWGLQQGLVVLPKSTRPERIRENLALHDFALDTAQMAALDALEENLVTGWNPQNVA